MSRVQVQPFKWIPPTSHDVLTQIDTPTLTSHCLNIIKECFKSTTYKDGGSSLIAKAHRTKKGNGKPLPPLWESAVACQKYFFVLFYTTCQKSWPWWKWTKIE